MAFFLLCGVVMEIQFKSKHQLPASLQQIPSPPKGLYFCGPWDLLEKPSLAVVGAREVQVSTRQWLENELGDFLVYNPLVIISGGARGVDQQAHSLAIRQNCPTIVVLPSGLDNIYPSSLQVWLGFGNVLFLSEYPPQQEMRRHHFYRRNRIISALSDRLLVVQAKEKSGTMITAKYGIEQGKEIMSVPGDVLNPNFAGNNQLLFDGAQMVRSSLDLKSLVPVSSQQEHTGGEQDHGR